MILALLWLGCTCRPDEAVQRAFVEARDEALAEPEALPDGWRPDAVLHLSASLTDRVLSRALAELPPIRARVALGAGVVAEPRLTVREVTVDGPGKCPTCVVATASLGGTVAYDAGIVAGTVPVEGTATVEVALAAERVKRGFRVTARAEEVRRVGLPGLPLPDAVVKRAQAEVRALVERELAGAEPVPVLTLGDGDLPVRLLGLRVAPDGRGLRVELRSAAVRPGKVRAKAAPTDADWTLEASLQSAVWLGRREAFRAGPLAFDATAVPESLALDGDRFTLGLRLWRTAAPGWWRDYRATGRIVLAGDQVAVQPDEVVEVAASEGAGMADPLALAAQGRVRSEMEAALRTSKPAALSVQTAAGRADLVVTEVAGDGDRLTLRGTATLR